MGNVLTFGNLHVGQNDPGLPKLVGSTQANNTSPKAA